MTGILAAHAATRCPHVDRRRTAVGSRSGTRDWLRHAADLHQVVRSVARPTAPSRRGRALPRARLRARHSTARGPRQLPHQRRIARPRVAPAIGGGAHRGARPRRRPRTPRGHPASGLLHDRYGARRPATRHTSDRRGLRVQIDRRRQAPAGAHGRPRHEPRPSIRASGVGHRRKRGVVAARSLPGHLPRAGSRLRYRVARRLRPHDRRVRRAHRAITTDGDPPERLEAPVRQPEGIGTTISDTVGWGCPPSNGSWATRAWRRCR